MAAHEYDAVVMDLRLPDKHGLVLLREMRERGDHTPVLILTAQGALQDRVRGLNLGADDFLTKPINIQELLARVRAVHDAPALVALALRAGAPKRFDGAARVRRLFPVDRDRRPDAAHTAPACHHPHHPAWNN